MTGDNSTRVLARAAAAIDTWQLWKMDALVRELVDDLKDAQRLLAEVRDLANGASWAENAANPGLFHQFVLTLLKSSNGFDAENL